MTDPILASLPDDANIDPPSWHESAPHADRDRSDRPVSTPSGLSAGLEGQDATQEPPDATEAALRPVYHGGCPDAGCGPECPARIYSAGVLEAIKDAATLRAERDAAEARVAELEATVARVRTLTSHLHTDTIYAGDLRAILDPPAP